MGDEATIREVISEVDTDNVSPYFDTRYIHLITHFKSKIIIKE